MDADDFRDYILGFIFYKYLSEKMEDYANTVLKPDNIAYSEVENHQQSEAPCWCERPLVPLVQIFR